MKPDQSIMPVFGSIRRTGARMGSVAWTRKPDTWLRPLGSTHDMIIRPNTSAHRAISRNWTKFRSEEHTSELQSLMRISYAVFCLKKKKHTNHNHNPT